MGIFNEILSPRYSRALQKLFSMKGHPPVKSLAGELVPSIAMFFGVENRYLEGWNSFGLVSGLTAGAGQFAALRIRNPTGSNVIAIVQKCSISFSVADAAWQLGRGSVTSDFGSIVTVPDWDLRAGGKASVVTPSVTTTGATQAANLPAGNNAIWGSSALASQLNDAIAYENEEIPLLPGGYVQLSGGVAAETMVGTFWWRERPLEESERT